MRKSFWQDQIFGAIEMIRWDNVALVLSFGIIGWFFGHQWIGLLIGLLVAHINLQ